MSKCCKGYTAKCDGCGWKGCSSCQVSNHDAQKSYCGECSDKIHKNLEITELEQRISYLEKLLDENNIDYKGKIERYNQEEVDRFNEECKTQ